MSSRWKTTSAIAAVATFLSSLFLLQAEPNEQRTNSAIVAANGLFQNRPVPRFEFQTMNGDRVDLEGLGDDTIYLNFWGTWCETCRDEMPSLHAFANEFSSRISVVTVSINDELQEVTQFLEQNQPSSNILYLFDRGGEVAHTFGTSAVPETYVIEPSGEIIAHFIGPQNFTSSAHRRLAELLTRRSL